MKVVILGCSKIGTLVANWLYSQKHEVSVIDVDVGSFRRLDKDANIRQVVGMGIDYDILKKAGIERADAFIAVTNSDNTNLTAAQIAQAKFKIPKVISRVRDPKRAKAFEEIGLNIICPTIRAAEELKTFLLKKDSE